MFGAIQGVPAESWADDADRSWVSRVISIQGHVVVKRRDKNDWQPAGLDEILFIGDRIRVKANSRAGIVLSNDAVLRLDQNTTLVFTEIERPGTFIIRLLKGAANFFSHRPRTLKIVTPFVNGVVEGTEFYIRVDTDQTRIDLFEGRVLAMNDRGELQLTRGQGAVAVAGRLPQRRIVVRPRDSVQWALYYPPVLTLGHADLPEPLRESLVLYEAGRLTDAIDLLDRSPVGARKARFFTLRAALLLHVGRVSRAREDIAHALASDPQNSDALALQAVIAVVQNEKAQALALAEKAVETDPTSAAAHIALSYAHQAAFNLSKALKAARAAVGHAPENSTARARLAELQLCAGELDKGMRTSRKAAQLNPDIARAHTIEGFAYLTRIETDAAQRSFNAAIARDSAAPLPRLGLGLAKIRQGNLEEGRAEIEIAAALDPANALIRSYLGKAYFDEKRGPLDERQLEIAKQLDPNDPTPYYYNAIRKQTLNRPVEALQDLQKSIELNDNRAVFRSRFMLDRDLASRSASLSRIYWDLNFQELAIREGFHSLNADPANYSAHRLLADTYASRPRHDISRVSELLQAKLLQPINLTPTQPQLAETNLFILDGA
jgi:Tfp pilus assembly protein PilF